MLIRNSKNAISPVTTHKNLKDVSKKINKQLILRKIKTKPKATQRQLAKELGFSLGKLNYCLKSLNQKGLIKIKNFQKNPNKLGYAYMYNKEYKKPLTN